MSNTKWMLISKPLRKPFNDGTLVFCDIFLRSFSKETTFTYFGDPQDSIRQGLGDEVLEVASMGFSPSFINKMKLLLYVFSPLRRKQPIHWLFTPNKMTSRIVAELRRLYPKRVMIQTVMSSDGVEKYISLLGSLDAVCVFSKKAKDQMIQGGLSADKVHLIYPAVEETAKPSNFEERRSILYAGDLDKKVAHKIVSIVRGLQEQDLKDWSFIVACRPKSPEDTEARKILHSQLKEEMKNGHIEILGEVTNMEELFNRSALQVFLSEHVKKKVDLPFVLLEGLARGLGLVALDIAPINEIFELAEKNNLLVGSVVNKDNNDELTQMIVKLLKDTTQLKRYSNEAQKLIQQSFSIDQMSKKYKEVYDKFSI